MAGKSIHQGHRERMRDRFLRSGADSLCEHELLEIILFYGIPRINTNELAHRLLESFGSLGGVMSASKTELMKVKGIGSAAADFICMFSDMCSEYKFLYSQPQQKVSGKDLPGYFRSYFQDSVPGMCLLVTLSDQLDIISKMSFSSESVTDSKLNVQKTAEFIIKSGCRRIAVGINRPDKLPIPDNSDFRIAEFFMSRYSSIGIGLEDYVICGRTGTFSMRENGAFLFSR